MKNNQIFQAIFSTVTASMFALWITLGAGGGAAFIAIVSPVEAHAATKKLSSAQAQYKKQINSALKQACLPGGLFDGFIDLFGIIDDISKLLASFDDMLASAGVKSDPGLPNIEKCIPNFNPNDIFGINQNGLQNCLNQLPIPKCSFPTNFNPEQALKSCIQGLVNFNPPNLDNEIAKIMACVTPNPDFDYSLPDIIGLFESLIGLLNDRIASLGDILKLKNIQLAKFFIEICGQVKKGKIGLDYK